jgi:acyl-CoA dehydrogenase
VRKFIREEIVPLERELDPEAVELPAAEYERLSRKVKDAGLWCMGAPAAYGGGDLGCFAMTVVNEEMSQHRNGLYGAAYGVFGRYPPPVIWRGTEEQIQKYGVPALHAGQKAFFAITEPSGGSDPAGAIRSRAIRDGDNWVVNGSKTFISGAHDADWGVVWVRTDPEKGRRGITAFIVDRSLSGWSTRLVPVIRPWYPSEITFEDCVVPHANMLGQQGEGFDLVNHQLGLSRFPYSAANIGVAVAAQRMAIDYCKQRVTFGEPLAQRQAIQWMLADSEVEIRAARWLTWEGAWKVDAGEEYRQEASIAKLMSSEVLGRVVDRSVQIHGGYGVCKEFPLERWYRESRIRRLGEGPSEVHRMVIARNLLRG